MTFTVKDLAEIFELREGRLHKRGGGCCENQEGTTKSYLQVSFTHRGVRHVGRVHRIKFALAHGFFPLRVDHQNRDIHDNSLTNLRAADARLNAANASRAPRALPCGVRMRKSGRFSAYAYGDGRQVCLGTFDTVDEAQEAARKARLALYGDFYDEA